MSNNDLYCSRCKSQHHPVDDCVDNKGIMTIIKKRNKEGFYTINGKPHLSVTTLINGVLGMPESMVKFYHCKVFWEPFKTAIINLLSQVEPIMFATVVNLLGNQVYQQAIEDRDVKGKYGIWAHDQLYNYYYSDNKGMIHPDLTNRALQIDKIYKDLGLEPLEGETVLYSDKLKCAGSCDDRRVSRKFKEPQYWFIDYKTGSAQKKKELVQIAAYGHFAREMNMIPDDYRDNIHGLILHIGRKPDDRVSKTIFSPSQMKAGYKGFKNLLGYYNLLKK